MWLGGLGSAVNSPSGIWGGAAVEIEFIAFKPYNLTSSGNSLNSSHENQLAKFLSLSDFRGFRIFAPLAICLE